MVKRIVFGCIIYVFLIQSLLAEISASVDRKTVRIDETLTLTINSDRPLTLAPDLNLLTSALQPLSRSNFSSTSYVNGKRVVQSGWKIQLIALEEGIITIPSFTIDNEKTKPIQIKVLPANQTNVDGSPAPLFTEVKISDINPFIQQQIILTVKVSSDSDIDNAQLQPPQIENAIVRSLGEPTEYVSRLSGELYRIREYQFSIFPQAEGLMKIPAMIFQGNKIVRYQSRNPFSLLSSQSRRVRTRTEELLVDVKPAIPSAHTWLPAQKISLSSSWRPEPQVLTVGDPITRILKIEAEGLDATQLPEFTMPDIEGLSWFPNPAERENSFDGSQISSKLVQRFALMPNKKGNYTLPAIEIHWYDINNQKFVTSRVEALEIQVLAAEKIDPLQPQLDNIIIGGSKSQASQETAELSVTEDNFWKYLALSSILLWLLTIIVLIVNRSRTRTVKSIANDTEISAAIDNNTALLKPAKSWKAVAKQIKDMPSINAFKLIKQKSELEFKEFDQFLDYVESLQQVYLANALRKLSQAAFSDNPKQSFDPVICQYLPKLDVAVKSSNNKKGGSKISPLYD